jgi:drug/metabolite transporter (DMT)-like permease
MRFHDKRSIAGALAAAILFGASTPAAKALGADLHPLTLAGLLYAGSGMGLSAWLLVRRITGPARSTPGVALADIPWLAGSVVTGGMIAPGLLMMGLVATEASVAALLLNLESVFTALMAWFVFRENFDRRIAIGMALIAAGGIVLSVSGSVGHFDPAALLVSGACFFWAIDNNLTRKISGGDPIVIAALKGGVAGATNLVLAAVSGAAWPAVGTAVIAMTVGFAGYGLSLVLFVIALRELGAARTGAYFSTAPFAGVILAIAVLGEPAAGGFWLAGLLMAAGVWLHVTEQHVHTHTHEPMNHTHAHSHDEHHRHGHEFDWHGHGPHTHRHEHARLTHRHSHFPDIHHRHEH